MTSTSPRGSEDGTSVPSDGRRPDDPIGWWLGCSAVLHLLVIALLLVPSLRHPSPLPPPPELAVVVELLQPGEAGTPAAARQGPQQAEERAPQPRPQEAEPAAQETPVPESPRPRSTERNFGAGVARQPRARPPDRSRTEVPARELPAEGGKPRRSPRDRDDLESLLRSVESTHRRTSAPFHQGHANEPASSTPMGSDQAVGQGRPGTRGVKDFIRAQIERHWEFDLHDIGDTDLVVSLHLELGSDGSVRRVELVDDPRYGTDARYRSVATSARNAALLSSPLHLPPGTYDDVKNITVTLDPRDTLR